MYNVFFFCVVVVKFSYLILFSLFLHLNLLCVFIYHYGE